MFASSASALAVLAACEFDATRNPAYGCEACSPPDRCLDGYCVRAAPVQQGGVTQTDAGDASSSNVDASPGAACDLGASEPCYDGPAGSEQHPPCRAGRKTCSADGALAECRGQVLPALEACNALDDDCDGTVDEQSEVETRLCGAGACCDGGCVDLASDSEHCGGCGRECKRGTRCCAGACVDPNSDPNHCGACGLRCPGTTGCCAGECADTQTDRDHCGPFCLNCAEGEACCFGACADLESFQHCGSCERVCSQGELCCGGKCSVQRCE